jgi:cytochrome c oxidase subunit 1
MEMSILNDEKAVRIEPGLKNVVLTELVFPVILLIFGIYHGLMQYVYRSGLIHQSSVAGIDYYEGLTAHGVINAIVFTTFFAIAFGNILVRYCLEIPLNLKLLWVSAGLMMAGTLAASIAIFSGQASVLYTFYPPLKAHPAFYLGLAGLIIGSWIGFYAWIPNYLRWRKENPGKKTPLAVVGIFAAFIVWMIATLPVAYEVLVLLLPWSLGRTPTVNVVLARTLFWFFGHPLVYFWIIPAYVMYYTMLPRVAGGKLYTDFGGRLAFMWFIVFSSPLGLHHQFTEPGINANYKFFHSILTFLVAFPSFMTAFVVAASLEYAARRKGGTGYFAWWKKLPYFDTERWLFGYFFCGLVIFIFGGITGIVNASYSMNRVVHNTAWMPAHFHMTVAGPVFLSFIGMTLYLVLQLTGKSLKNKKLTVSVPWLWMAGIFLSSGATFVTGLQGMPRRTNLGLGLLDPNSPTYHPEWLTSGLVALVGGSVMTLAMVIYFYIIFRTLLAKSVPGSKSPEIKLPMSEALHNENVSWVLNFKPWVIAAILAVIIAYAPPLLQIINDKNPGAKAFDPSSPAAVETK